LSIGPASAATLLDSMKVGEALGKYGVSGAGPVLPFTQDRKGERRRRQARARHHHPVGKDFEHDLPSAILILAVRNRVDERFTQTVDRIFIETDAIESDNAHRVARVPIDEGDGAIIRQWHGQADVLMVARIAVRLRAPVGIGQDAALGKDHRRVFGKKDDTGGGRIRLARARFPPDKAPSGGAEYEVCLCKAKLKNKYV
jgi:hypothetical protein